MSQTTSTQVGMAKKYADEIRSLPKKKTTYPPSGSCIGNINTMRAETDGLLRSKTTKG